MTKEDKIKEICEQCIGMLGGALSEATAHAISEGYKLGANAVLEEIEKELNSAHYLSDLSCKTQLYDNLVSLVERLKKG